MKDLTEAELIEMERRAVYLVNELETDPSKLSKSGTGRRMGRAQGHA
jgi:hypothetical protein